MFATNLCCSRKGVPRGFRWSLGCAKQVLGPTWKPEYPEWTLPLAVGAPPESPQQEGLASNQSLMAGPRNLLCLFSSGEHFLDIYPQFNNAELLIPPTGTIPAEARALTGYIIKISTSEKPLSMRWIIRTINRMVWVGRDLQDPRAQVFWPWLLQGDLPLWVDTGGELFVSLILV